jgi:hypothetical protein
MDRFLVCLCACAVAGCSALIDPDGNQLGGGGGLDAGPGTDTGPRPDTGGPMVDAGTDVGPNICVIGERSCDELDVLVECLGDRYMRTGCRATGEVCVESGGTAFCGPDGTECMPGDSRCTDTTTLDRCTIEGRWESMDCEDACIVDGAGARCGASPGCPPGTPSFCEGSSLVECVDGVFERTNCADAGETCASTGDGAMCVGPSCSPADDRCDGNTAIRCVGGALTMENCGDNVCVHVDGPPTCRADPCAGLDTIGSGDTENIDLCAETAGNHYEVMNDCRSTSTGNDVILRLEIESEGDYTIRVEDDDGSASIDTVVYLRAGSCMGRQIACSDDDDCRFRESGCIGEVQYRRSVITERLEPGVYYIVVDHYFRDGWTCGDVEVQVSRSFFPGG